MKILITGSNGLLGQKLVHLLRNKKEVVVLATSKGENRISEKEGYTYKQLDITNPEEIKEIFNQFQPTVLINTAAMTNVDACEVEKEMCDALNVSAVEYLIESCEAHHTHFIHLSTDFIFDGKKSNYEETDIPFPQSYYGNSKLKSEELLQKSSCSWSIARTIILYGVAEKMSRSNIVLWAKEALKKGEKLNVVNDQYRSPTLAEDLAEGCWQIAKRKATGVFHLSGKECMSILELVISVADFYQLDKSFITPVSSDTLNQKAARPKKTGFNLTKSINVLGYSPHSFKEGLQIVEEQLNK